MARRHGGHRVRNNPLVLRDPNGNIANTRKGAPKSKSIMERLKNAGGLDSTMGQDIAKGIKGSMISKKSKNVRPQLFKVSSLTNSKSIPDRGTIAANRQRIYTSAKTNRVYKIPRNELGGTLKIECSDR